MVENSVRELRGTTRWLGLAGWLLVSFGAASMGALFMPDAWYARLNKPTWNPPAWVFGPVWGTLYTMMSVSAWLVWQRGGFAAKRVELGLYFVQLALNAGWTPLFFGLHRPGFAFGEILFLWVAIAVTMAAFLRVSRLAGWLLMPYLAWMNFAAVLNFTIWRLNL